MTDQGFRTFRKDYEKGALSLSEIAGTPAAQLEAWLQEASTAGILEPNAMTLASVDHNRQPSARIVLLRGLAEDGLRFFTNYESRKGKELIASPRACVLFFWPHLERQVRVEGLVTKITQAESAAYFAGRPRDSQIGAWASKQSEHLETREELEASVQEHTEKFEGKDVPLPSFWGGFILKPTRFEFWQGRKNRLHDRIVYKEGQAPNEWTLERLYP
jgi:pyridoxamine 5'-phosphate oxidase